MYALLKANAFSGLSISFEVAGYFQKVGGEMHQHFYLKYFMSCCIKYHDIAVNLWFIWTKFDTIDLMQIMDKFIPVLSTTLV